MYYKEINEYYLRMMLLKTGIFMNKYIFFDILVRSERLELLGARLNLNVTNTFSKSRL